MYGYFLLIFPLYVCHFICLNLSICKTLKTYEHDVIPYQGKTFTFQLFSRPSYPEPLTVVSATISITKLYPLYFSPHMGYVYAT